MKSKLLIIIFLIISTLSFYCTKDTSSINIVDITETPRKIQLSENEKIIVNSSNEFGLNLFNQVNESTGDTNIFISPLSVSMALGMTLNGANGETFEAMRQTLAFDGLTNEEVNQSYLNLINALINLDEKTIFEIANSIWYREGFIVKQDFMDINQYFFNAEIQSLNFTSPGAVTTINNWVKNKTHDKIKEIIKEINPATVMILINAIYFNGLWTYEFNKGDTKDDIFLKENGNQIQCEMMSHRMEHPYFENDDFQAVDLAYGEGDFSMMIFLPKYGKTLDNLIDSFDKLNFSLWLNNFHKDSVDLFLPKFKVEYDQKLKDILSAMGMDIAFTPGQADFSRISESVDLFISQVLHKTFVRVDEEGTEAAAVTAVIIELTSIQPETVKTMRVDHPFLFLIYEKQTDTILFMGKIVEPLWE